MGCDVLMAKKVEGILPNAKRRAKMTAIERKKFKEERAAAKATEGNEEIASNEEFFEMMDNVFQKSTRVQEKRAKESVEK